MTSSISSYSRSPFNTKKESNNNLKVLFLKNPTLFPFHLQHFFFFFSSVDRQKFACGMCWCHHLFPRLLSPCHSFFQYLDSSYSVFVRHILVTWYAFRVMTDLMWRLPYFPIQIKHSVASYEFHSEISEISLRSFVTKLVFSTNLSSNPPCLCGRKLWRNEARNTF